MAPGVAADRAAGLDAPLIRRSATSPEEQPTVDVLKKRDAAADWWQRKWKLVMYMLLMLLSSVGNTVYFKKMTTAMPNYGWYLTQLSTIMYVPFFAACAGTGIVEVDKQLLKKFAWMGFFDGLSGTFMVLGGVHTSGTMQVLLSQAVIPITMVLSSLLLRKRYHMLQQLGAATIVMGIVIAKVHSSGGAGGDSDEDNIPIFNALFCVALLPSALSSVYKEIAFRGFDGDLDANVLQFWVAVVQVAVNFSAMPIYSLQMLGPQRVPMSDMGSITVGGSRCLFMAQDQVVNDCGLPDQKPCDHCGSAYLPVFLYLFFNLALNISAILVIKNGSATLTFLVSTLRMPLAALAFSSTLIMGSDSVSITFGDFLSLAIILAGLCTYRFGAKMLKRQLRSEAESAADGDLNMIPSPSPRNSWASPSASPTGSPSEARQGGEGSSSRWRFMPVFTAGGMGNLSAQPQMLVIQAPKQKQARSANRVREDLLRRLGAALPVNSPNSRHKNSSPSSWPSSPEGRAGGGEKEASGPVDFSLTGL